MEWIILIFIIGSLKFFFDRRVVEQLTSDEFIYYLYIYLRNANNRENRFILPPDGVFDTTDVAAAAAIVCFLFE